MGEPTTFIKLDRSVVNWRWFHDGNVLMVWIYLLITAHAKDEEKGMDIERRGTFETSYGDIADRMQVSYSKVRGAICKLVSTGEITYTPHGSKCTLTINNYDKYQGLYQKSQAESQGKSQGKSQTESQPYINNGNKGNKENKNTIVIPTLDDIRLEISMNGLSVNAEKFRDYYNDRGWLIGNRLINWKSKLRKWDANEKEKKSEPPIKEVKTDNFGNPIDDGWQ